MLQKHVGLEMIGAFETLVALRAPVAANPYVNLVDMRLQSARILGNCPALRTQVFVGGSGSVELLLLWRRQVERRGRVASGRRRRVQGHAFGIHEVRDVPVYLAL
jgi:hypothetical protein